MTEELDKLLELAQQVGGDAWPLLVQATHVEGMVGFVVGCVLVTAAGICGALTAWQLINDDDPWAAIPTVVLVVVGSIAIGFNILPAFYPEAAAVQRLLP